MATNPRPQMRIKLNYGDINSAVAARSLNPVFIAARYAVHSYKDGYDDGDVGIYDAGVGLTKLNKYGTLEVEPISLPKKDENGVINTTGLKVVLDKPLLTITNDAIDSVTLDAKKTTLTLNLSTAFKTGTTVEIGDTISFKDGSSSSSSSSDPHVRPLRTAVITKVNLTNLAQAKITIDRAVTNAVYELEIHTDRYSVNANGGTYLEVTPTSTANNKVSLGTTATVSVNISGTATTLNVFYGHAIACYRELLVSDSEELYSSADADSRSWAGVADPENPMGMMYAAAMNVSNCFFYMVAPKTDDDNGYIDAVEYAAQYENCYAFVPYKQSEAVKTAVLAAISKYSEETIAQFKVGWFYSAVCDRDDYSELDKRTVAQLVANECSGYNNERLRVVWCNGVTFNGFTDVSRSVVLAILAAQRNGLPPHAPLSDVVVPGILLNNEKNMTEAQYEIMNNGGAWVVSPNADKEVITYHQITTKTDGTYAEEDSCVSAGDYIVRSMRTALKPYANGKVNISDQLIGRIKAVINAQATYLMGLTYADTYGPILNNYEIVKIETLESNKSSLIATINFEIPHPFLSGTFTFNLL